MRCSTPSYWPISSTISAPRCTMFLRPWPRSTLSNPAILRLPRPNPMSHSRTDAISSHRPHKASLPAMSSLPMSQFPGFTPDALAALEVLGVAERWTAVQERLHPPLAALAEALREAGARRFPREWGLYEISYRSLRYVNRKPGERTPIDEYHFALDRPPRGAGIYVAVSGAERLIVVALQL